MEFNANSLAAARSAAAFGSAVTAALLERGRCWGVVATAGHRTDTDTRQTWTPDGLGAVRREGTRGVAEGH